MTDTAADQRPLTAAAPTVSFVNPVLEQEALAGSHPAQSSGWANLAGVRGLEDAFSVR